MFGIITLNTAREYNYGCLLQNYALKHYLNKEGMSADAIWCNAFSFMGACNAWVYRFLNLDLRKEERKFYAVDHAVRKKNDACSAFVKQNIRPKHYFLFNARTHRDIARKFDKVIVGSDQVWNPHWAVDDKSAATYLLTFLPPEKRVSYAASFGSAELPVRQKQRYKKALQDFCGISVREDAGKKIVEELTGREDVQVLIDPTLLLTADDWDTIAQKPKMLPDRYILTYFLGDVSPERRAAIAVKAKTMNCQIIDLMDKNSPFYASGPEQFIYLIKNAAFVCTDSFHASVFSFLYQRPLAIFHRTGAAGDMSSRVETFVSKFSLQNCIVTEKTLTEAPAIADYASGFAALERERKKAKAFLKTVLA